MDADAEHTVSSIESSYLCQIEVNSQDPIDLFKEWYQEAKSSEMVLPNRITVSSASSNGEVTSRSLLLRQLEDDGFVIMTDARSLKIKQWQENPRAAFTFFWGYKKGDRTVARQVRAEGPITQLSSSDYSHLYESEPLYCKIRAHICHQGRQVEWNELKASHDALLESYKNGETTLPMPDHVVFYKLVPNVMEFYSANEISIGDRVIFIKESGISAWKESWRYHHISA